MMHTSKSNSKKHNQQECVNSSNAILKRVAVLALPWAVLVATSLLLTAWETKWNGINDFMSSSDLSSSSSSSSSFVPRVLQQMTTSSSSHVQSVSSFSSSPPHHHHKPVYNEDHKPLFPLDASDQWGVFFAVLGLMIAAGGGVGGGGLLVPIFILVMGFTPKHAIPLSNITVFGGACANTLLNARKRHPQANRPLVDWDLILVMEPLTIAGALMGAFLNKLLPEELLTVLLVALLSYTSYETLKKAFKMYRKETQQMKLAGESELALMAQAEEHDADDEAAEELLKPVVDNDTPTTGETGSGTADKSADDGTPKKTTDDESVPMVESAFVMAQKRKLQQELEQILQGESVTPKENIYILLALFVVVLSINLLKGGGAFPSPLGIKCGSMPFWVANGLMLAWIVAITIYVRHHLVAKHERKLATGFVFLEGDIQWDTRATIVYPVICAAAGFFAGTFVSECLLLVGLYSFVRSFGASVDQANNRLTAIHDSHQHFFQ